MNGQGSDSGDAGRSARREYERRRERRQQSARSKSGLVRLFAALFGPSAKEKRQLADEKHWATGAQGEAILAEVLAKRCPNVPVLHDRRVPRSRANIDHIAVGVSGVYVKIKGYPLYYPRRLAKRLNRSGPLTREQAHKIHAALAERLAPA
jgi:hypothetical protein